MFDKDQLISFLVEAKKSTYAAGDLAQKTIESDKSTTLIFDSGDWYYNDNYFGGEPYGGREVVLFKKKPIYIMTYYGRVDDFVDNIGEVYSFLQDALKLIPKNYPYRGPEMYCDKDFLYKNNFTGQIDNFYGEEIILHKEKEIYKARYIGGFVGLKN